MKNIYLLLIIVVSSFMLSGCVYQFGGAKSYDVKSDTEEGEEYVEEYEVRYISPDIYGLFFTDFYRAEGFFATYVEETSDQINYYEEVSASESERLELKPAYSLWEKFGKFAVSIGIILGAFVYFRFGSDSEDDE